MQAEDRATVQVAEHATVQVADRATVQVADGAGVPPGCRFDDLRAGRAWEMVGPLGEIRADRLADVRPALRQVDEVVAAGHYAAGFVSYEAAPAFDPALVVRPPAVADQPAGDPVVPLVWFGIFAGRRGVPVVAPAPGGAAPSDDGGWCWDLDEAGHSRALASVRRRIAVGDVYQVNVTGRLRRPWPAGGADGGGADGGGVDAGGVDGGGVDGGGVAGCYRQLVHAQQGAYHALVRTGDVSVACASPELFLAIDGGWLTCRPMKGTVARGRPAGGPDDRRRAAVLAASAKERAENVMIVDLLRNDVGRVAATGTVEVPALCTVEAFPTVWQLTSTVRGRLAGGSGLDGVLAALFPCGSVTGAPKAAAMAAIAELEGSPRGVYCGAVGWVGPGHRGPRARFAVAIRTVVVDHRHGVAAYGVGGGVTWPSEAAAEWQELQAKAAVLRAVRWPLAGRRAG